MLSTLFQAIALIFILHCSTIQVQAISCGVLNDCSTCVSDVELTDSATYSNQADACFDTVVFSGDNYVFENMDRLRLNGCEFTKGRSFEIKYSQDVRLTNMNTVVDVKFSNMPRMVMQDCVIGSTSVNPDKRLTVGGNMRGLDVLNSRFGVYFKSCKALGLCQDETDFSNSKLSGVSFELVDRIDFRYTTWDGSLFLNVKMSSRILDLSKTSWISASWYNVLFTSDTRLYFFDIDVRSMTNNNLNIDSLYLKKPDNSEDSTGILANNETDISSGSVIGNIFGCGEYEEYVEETNLNIFANLDQFNCLGDDSSEESTNDDDDLVGEDGQNDEDEDGSNGASVYTHSLQSSIIAFIVIALI